MKLKHVVINPYFIAGLLALSTVSAQANPFAAPPPPAKPAVRKPIAVSPVVTKPIAAKPTEVKQVAAKPVVVIPAKPVAPMAVKPTATVKPVTPSIIPTANITAQVSTNITTLVSAVVSGPVVFVPPPPMTNEFFMAHESSQLMNHPQLNKITDLLNLVELEGMQKSWYLSEASVAHLNELVIQKNTKALATDVRRTVQKIVSEFYGGRVRPAQIATQYKVISKKLQSYQIEDINRYLKNEMTAEELLNDMRPKNKYYAGLIEQYRKFKAGRDANYFPMGPESIAIIRPSTKDAVAIGLVRYRLHVLGYTNDIKNPNYSADLRKAILAFQANHKLGVDGTIGPMGWKMLNFNIDNLLARLIINIDRTRWLPDDMGYEYVNVNLASQKLKYYVGDQETMAFNVIAGKTERPTPILFDKIDHFILNPTWTVPQSILIKDKLKVFKANPAKVAELHIKIVDKNTYLDVDPYSVDWDSITETNYPYHFIQQPGPWNALGFIKFPMGNGYAIYMHDTDDRNKLREQMRLYSSGCIRLEKPFDFAEKLLNNPAMTAQQLKEMTELLPRPAIDPNFPMMDAPKVSPSQMDIGREVPVYVLYATTSLSSAGEMTLSNDYYGLDLLTFNIMNQAL